MLFRRPKLYEADPTKLDIEALLSLRAALTAKLLLVNREVRDRSAAFLSMPEEIQGAENATFKDAYEFSRGFGVLLESALAKFVGSENSN